MIIQFFRTVSPMSLSPQQRAESLSMQQVQSFCRVYELGGYANASGELGLAGPTLWEQVKSLEKVYKARLFERVGRNVRPTASGHLLYRLLLPLIATVESSFNVLAEADATGSKLIRLVTGVRMMLEELGDPLRKFAIEHPDHRLRLMTADNRVAQELILLDKADIALLIEPPRDVIMQGIECQILYPIEYLIAFPPKHKLASKKSFSFQDLENQPLIAGNPDTVGRRMLEQAWFRLGIKTPIRITAETDNSAVTLACVRAGLGIGIIAGRIDGNLTKQLVTKSAAKELGIVNVVAATKAGRTLTQVLARMLEHLRLESPSTS